MTPNGRATDSPWTHISVSQVQDETVLYGILVRVHSHEQANRCHCLQLFQVTVRMNLHRGLAVELHRNLDLGQKTNQND